MAREERRLRLVFGAALAAATGPALVLACSGGPAGPSADASTVDSPLLLPADTGADGTDASLDAAYEAETRAPGDCVTTADLDSAYVPVGSDVELCLLTLPCGLPYGYGTSGCEIIDALHDGGPVGCSFPDDADCLPDALQPNVAIQLECHCDTVPGGGRRPQGWRREASSVRGADRLGIYLARLAVEEAVSVHAFRFLHDDLARLGAPPELCRASLCALGDEQRHTRMVQRLARRRGVEARFARPRRTSPADLEALAHENAVEGCARETYGALLARWQARHAGDARLRAAFRILARDETRHAALAWATARWAEPRLDPAARARVRRARTDAVQRLYVEISRPVDPRVAFAAGIPSPDQGRALLEAMVGLVC